MVENSVERAIPQADQVRARWEELKEPNPRLAHAYLRGVGLQVQYLQKLGLQVPPTVTDLLAELGSA